MSDLFENHIVGFPTRRLKCLKLLFGTLLFVDCSLLHYLQKDFIKTCIDKLKTSVGNTMIVYPNICRDLSNNYIRDLDKDVFNNRDILESV